MKKSLALLLAISFCLTGLAAVSDSSFREQPVTLHTATGDISGTLTTPKNFSSGTVALIIAGSGPTDRNGNNAMMRNDGLKQLAYALADARIASLRFDKRGIAASAGAGKQEKDLRFEDYISDAKDWLSLLKRNKRFTRVVIIGHSEGSLIGMMAASAATAFISIAGAGRAADVILKEQLIAQPQQIRLAAYNIIDSLKSGDTVTNVNPLLNSLFRKSVQPYMISWFKYDPQKAVEQLTIPILILQGTADLQVTEADAQMLAKANPMAKLHIVEHMNHLMKIINGDKAENIRSYNDPLLPLSTELTKAIINFIKQV